MRLLGLILSVLPVGMTIGCGTQFMPMGDHYAVFDLNMPADFESAGVRAFICAPDKSVCGRRRGDEDHHFDILFADYNGYDIESSLQSTGSERAGIEAGAFRAEGVGVGPNDLRSIWFNDLPPIPIDIPPRFQISSPLKNAEISRLAQETIRVEWSPSGKGFPMSWKLFPVDNEAELLPCDMLNWQSFEGEGEDTGFVDIPIDVFPSDLPPEGCPMAFRVSRIKSFDLPEGIAHGDIRSRVTDGVFFRMIP